MGALVLLIISILVQYSLSLRYRVVVMLLDEMVDRQWVEK
jgi:hypothetical protein